MCSEGCKNKKIEKEWESFLDITSKYSSYEYRKITKIQIKKEKERTGGCCYTNGYIIGIANSSREAMAVDPIKKSVVYFGNTRIGTFKWTGGCEYKGKCYGFPRKSNNLLVIDTSDNTVREIPLGVSYRGEHHFSGTVTSKGILYQPPRNTDHILVTDLNDFSVRMIPMPDVKCGCRYSSAVVHPNGDIYFMPEFGYRMAILHTDNEEVEYFGSISEHLIFGMVVGIDGCIYGFSKEGKGILRVNTDTQKVDYLCQEIGNPDCYGSIIGINGKIYGVPANGKTIWEFDVKEERVKTLFELENQEYAQCAGAGMGTDGTIVIMPCFGEYVYCLSVEAVSLTEDQIKNRYINGFY